LIDGITGGNISVANAYLADISSDENRSKNFGKIAISSNLGFIVGPAMAGILGATIYQEILPVLAALFLSLITLIVIFPNNFSTYSQICISNLFLAYSLFCSTLSKTALFHQYTLNDRSTAICVL
jgi:MFS family permease